MPDRIAGEMLPVRGEIKNNRIKNGIDGWRVEIFNSSGSNALKDAEKVKQEFLSIYPDIGVYIKFQQPNFKVRVGDFRTRNEALKLRKEIMKKYPKSFEVWGRIKFPPLNQDVEENNRNE